MAILKVCAFFGCENLIDIKFPNYKDCNIHKYAFEITPYEGKFPRKSILKNDLGYKIIIK